MTRRFAQRAMHRVRMTGMHVWMPLIRTGTGSEVYTHVLARRLRERGHRVTLDAVPHLFQYAPWLAPVSVPADADVTLANSWNAAAFASPAKAAADHP